VKHKELPAPTRPEDSAVARVTAARNNQTGSARARGHDRILEVACTIADRDACRKH
jgi:hypothetical protein